MTEKANLENAVQSAGADETPYEQFARVGYTDGYEKGVADGRRQILKELCDFTRCRGVEIEVKGADQSKSIPADPSKIYRVGSSDSSGQQREAEQIPQQDNDRRWDPVSVGQGSADLGPEKFGT
jgi:hypothetical protein